MELSQLYSRGTKMADVDPNFRGMPFREWQCRQVQEQAKSPRVAKYWEQFLIQGKPPLAWQRPRFCHRRHRLSNPRRQQPP